LTVTTTVEVSGPILEHLMLVTAGTMSSSNFTSSPRYSMQAQEHSSSPSKKFQVFTVPSPEVEILKVFSI